MPIVRQPPNPPMTPDQVKAWDKAMAACGRYIGKHGEGGVLSLDQQRAPEWIELREAMRRAGRPWLYEEPPDQLVLFGVAQPR